MIETDYNQAMRYYNNKTFEFFKNRNYPAFYWREPREYTHIQFGNWRVATYTTTDLKIIIALIFYPIDEDKRHMYSKNEYPFLL